MPPFGFDLQTISEIHGVTKNPYDLRLTSGGSSGGSATSVALGIVPLSIGTDLSGSLRIPASYCGVPSIRPTINRVSRHGNIPPIPERDGLQSLLTVGAFGANISWLVRFMQVACDDFVASEDKMTNISVLITPYIKNIDIDERLVEVMESVANELKKHSNIVCDEIIPNLPLKEMRSAYDTLASSSEMNDKYKDALKKMENARSVVDEMTKNHNVWILPCSAVLPFPHNHNKSPIKIQHSTLKEIKYWKSMGYTTITSLIGNPIVTLPVATVDGLPVGVQVVGKRGQDEELLACCHLLETIFAKNITKPNLESIRSMM